MVKTIGDLNLIVESGSVLNRIRAEKNAENTLNMKVLMPKAVSDGIDMSATDLITVDETLLAEKRIKTTDLEDVVLKLTTPYDSVMIQEEEMGFVIPSYFAVIRNFDLRIINPKYLAFFLSSTYAKNYLFSVTTGASTAMLKIRDVLSIPVPMLPREEQEMLGDMYLAFCNKRAALKKYLASEEAMMDAIIVDAIRREA